MKDPQDTFLNNALERSLLRDNSQQRLSSPRYIGDCMKWSIEGVFQ